MTGWLPTVWAPDATQVDLHVRPGTAGDVRPMTQDGRGWWHHPERLPHGTDYAFSVDGADPRPDPRSPWQPYGVHAASRTFDTTLHVWSDADWTGRDVRGAVVYEMHVGTFTPEGTLDSAIDRLDHLVDLGVDMVELMPVAAFPGTHGWGYDGVALYAVHDPYGGPAALQRFVDAAHSRGVAVCLDVVHNHLGPSGNYLHGYGPYFTDRHHTPWGQAVNLDGPGSGEVRAFVLDSVERWFRDFHLDALRLDAVHALRDDSERHLLAEMADRVEELAAELGRPLSLIAESDLNDVRMVTPTDEGGLGMTAQWADDVHHALHAWITGERHGYYVDFGSADTLGKALTRAFVHDGDFSTFRQHTWGAPVPPETDGRRFVVFDQDHDQVGNRALGDRPSERLADGALAASAALMLLAPYTPMLFMGEEWGTRRRWQFFTDHSEPELVAGIRQGRLEEFGSHGWAEIYGGHVTVPDPQDPVTVETSRLDWSELDRDEHRRVLGWYRTLVALRREHPELASGDLTAARTSSDDGAGWFVLSRGDVHVVAVRAEGEVTVPVSTRDGDAGHVLAAWDTVVVEPGTVRLPGPGAVVLRG